MLLCFFLTNRHRFATVSPVWVYRFFHALTASQILPIFKSWWSPCNLYWALCSFTPTFYCKQLWFCFIMVAAFSSIVFSISENKNDVESISFVLDLRIPRLSSKTSSFHAARAASTNLFSTRQPFDRVTWNFRSKEQVASATIPLFVCACRHASFYHMQKNSFIIRHKNKNTFNMIAK